MCGKFCMHTISQSLEQSLFFSVSKHHIHEKPGSPPTTEPLKGPVCPGLGGFIYRICQKVTMLESNHLKIGIYIVLLS